MSTEYMIEMNQVNKWYGDFHVLKDVNLKVKKGQFPMRYFMRI